jgi:periplasmic divalent cation tolerance protein
MTDKIVVLSTCASQEDAEKISRHLLERRVAACVSILPGAQSFYWWQEAIEQSAEFLLIIKSRADLFDELQRAVAEVHPYEVPEVLALPVGSGAQSYTAWLDRELRAAPQA